MDKKIYKKIELYLDKENKNINLSLTKDLVNSLLFSYPNYFKTIKSINVCDFNGNFDGIFKINNKEAFWIPEGLFVENILIKDSDYAPKKEIKIKIKKQTLRTKKETKQDIPVNIFYIDKIEVRWTDYYTSNIKIYVDFIINFLKQNYSIFLKTIRKIDLTPLKDTSLYFYIDGKICNIISEKDRDLFFYNGKLIKQDKEYVSHENLKINTVKRTLRKTNSLNLGFIDCTQQFKHEKPFLWSIFCDVFEEYIDKIKIFNLDKSDFYLFISNISNFDFNKAVKLKDIFNSLNYTFSRASDILNVEDCVILKFKKE